MLCSYHCTAERFNINDLNLVKFHDDVAYLKFENGSEAFIFSYGVFVLWNSDAKTLETLRKLANSVAINPVKEIEISDSCQYIYGESTQIVEEEDLIHLGSDDALIKLAFSYALSQSSKLEYFEYTVSKTIRETDFLTKQVSAHGKTTLSKKNIAKLMGTLIQQKTLINLNCDLLDTPEFFWRRPRYEPFYLMTATFLDLRQRINVLYTRLEVVQKLYEFLTQELTYAHSSFLEWIIIILISVEILLELLSFIKP